jgi:hypothetical protein
VGPSGKGAVLRVHHGLPPAGTYEVVVQDNGRDVATKNVTITKGGFA